MHPTTRRLFDALNATKNIDGDKEPGQIAKFMGESQAVITNWKSRGVSKAGVLSAHAKAQINPDWIANGIGPMLTGVAIASDPNTAKRFKEKLKDWRMTASPRSAEVIDQLTLLAEKNALREDDWTLIEQLAKRMKASS